MLRRVDTFKLKFVKEVPGFLGFLLGTGKSYQVFRASTRFGLSNLCRFLLGYVSNVCGQKAVDFATLYVVSTLSDLQAKFLVA